MDSVQFHSRQKGIALTLTGIVSVLCVLSVIRVSALQIKTNQPEKQQQANQMTDKDSLRIEELSTLAYYYYDFLGDKRRADSISQNAVEYAENTYRPGLLLLAYIRYIECNDPGLNKQKALHYALEALKLSKNVASGTKLEWRAYCNLVKVYLVTYQYDKALSTSYQAFSIADAQQDDELKAESYLLIGQSLEGNNQKIEAFRNYLNTSVLAEKLENASLRKKSYSLLSGFYNHNKMYDKAIVYKLKQLDEITKLPVVDSAELMWAQYDLQAINVNSNNNKLNTNSIQDVFEFAIRTNNLRLKNYEIALYRTHLIEADKISQLILLYKNQYPDEFTRLKKENPSLYFRLQAYFNEAENKYDSAYYNLNQAEFYIQTDPNKILQSNFFQRFGQFLTRQHKYNEAVVKFRKSYDLAREASYFEYMLSASKSLESIYAQMNDFGNAYIYSGLNRALTDSINMLTENDQLLMLEIDHETRQREHLAELEHTETHRRHNLQYTAITIITMAMFVLLMMLGSLKVPKWVIKVLGFFSFILLFEFIIMLADHKIYELTNNEPWKILLIKIGLIAFLLPFHHWIEKKVIRYLISNKLLKIPRFSLQDLFKKQSDTPEATN